jgi:hypothetical protein
MKLGGLRLRQRDAVSCGPTVAVVAGALLDPARRALLTQPTAGLQWFVAEQGRVHAEVNRLWPRRLGTTPAGMASALTTQASRRGVTYRWRLCSGRRDGLADVRAAARNGWPVAMLVGRLIPRHWVLIVEAVENRFDCYEPSAGEVRSVSADDVRHACLRGLGYPRPFAFVVPKPIPAVVSNSTPS